MGASWNRQSLQPPIAAGAPLLRGGGSANIAPLPPRHGPMTQLTLFLDGTPVTGNTLPSLACLLGRGEPFPSCPDTRPFAPLLHSAGLTPESSADLPLAALTRLGTGQDATGLWLLADPVHQQADQDKVYLIAQAQLGPEENEEALRTLNQLFDEDGWAFHAYRPERWLLHLPAGLAPLTTPLAQALGMAIGPCLPQARDDTPWQRAQTEMQMLLHGCTFNQQREGQGLPMVNGVWLWGAGYLPEKVDVPWQAVWGESDLVRGMAALHRLPVSMLPVDYASWWQQAGEGHHWLHLSLAEGEPLEQRWFAPLLQALRRGELASLQIEAANGRRWHLTPRQVKRWWQRRLNLPEVLG